MTDVFYAENTGLLVLDKLENHAEGEFINNATVTVTITDKNGTAMTGDDWPSWPLSMVYIAGTDGQYRAVLADTMPFKVRRGYIAKIDANGGEGLVGQWRFPFTPQVRRNK